MLRAFNHTAQDFRIYVPGLRPILARRSNQQLPGLPRLNVESHRIGRHRMSALQVSKLDQLVANKSWITIGDDQVALTLLHRDSWRKRRGPGSSRIDDRCRG